MSDQTVTLADGGTVTVLLSKEADIPSEYAHHPLVHVLDAAKFGPDDVKRCFPSNSKALITTQHLPKLFYDHLHAEIRRRKAVCIYRPTKGGLEQLLDTLVSTAPRMNGATATVGEAATIKVVSSEKKKPGGKLGRKIAPRGSLLQLASENDPTRSIGEEAKRLFRVAQERGLQTTFGSVTQAITKYRRIHRQSSRPSSAAAPDTGSQMGGLVLIEQVIAGMQQSIVALTNLKDWVSKIDYELADARKKMETVQALASLAKDLQK